MSSQIISHTSETMEFKSAVEEARKRIERKGDQPHVTVQWQLELLEDLAQFDLGRFLIQNHGLNGYWTHYLCTHPRKGRLTGVGHDGKPLTEMERTFLDKFPSVLATQERFSIFQEVLFRQYRATNSCIMHATQ